MHFYPTTKWTYQKTFSPLFPPLFLGPGSSGGSNQWEFPTDQRYRGGFPGDAGEFWVSQVFGWWLTNWICQRGLPFPLSDQNNMCSGIQYLNSKIGIAIFQDGEGLINI